MRTVLLVAALVTLAACDTSSGPAPSDGTLLASTEWALVAFPGQTAEAGTTLSFESAGAFDGRAACNTYSGTYTALSGGVVGPRFRASVETFTEMACPGGLGAYETAYFGALETAVGWGVDGERLVLTLPDGAGEMVFERAE